jgi:hypothetical protein
MSGDAGKPVSHAFLESATVVLETARKMLLSQKPTKHRTKEWSVNVLNTETYTAVYSEGCDNAYLVSIPDHARQYRSQPYPGK